MKTLRYYLEVISITHNSFCYTCSYATLSPENKFMFNLFEVKKYILWET